MRYMMRKRLKNPAPLEIPERRQVGDVEAIFGSSLSDVEAAHRQRQHYNYPARGNDSEL